MSSFERAIAILDAGKTNKKVLVFNEQYQLIDEVSTQLPEISDEDGFACEDVAALTSWAKEMLLQLSTARKYDIQAVNFTSYGASFVHLNEAGKPFLPLYNYLKPYPQELQDNLFLRYGGTDEFCRVTASPVLGHLNSGLLLYRLAKERPGYLTSGYSLHLPQYLSYIASGQQHSEITSIGCHTMLWDFDKGQYHRWVHDEGLLSKLPPIIPSSHVNTITLGNKTVVAGAGLHDSSSALIPYLFSFNEPFVLLSTGTWSITLNPFNERPLTAEELAQDCLCYISYKGKPVKASRLFAGKMHEEAIKRLCDVFHKQEQYFTTLRFNSELVEGINYDDLPDLEAARYASLPDAEAAYHVMMLDLVQKQAHSTNLVLSPDITQLYVDGGFSKNEVYMHLLSRAYSDLTVRAASVAQATALGAALAIHEHWNPSPIPERLVDIRD